ncbi:hypothetical protein [Corynebacterium belfantii]|uniref:hypothetical protein n=1 Tax=Corynebacterium belfantii TaxID=2014537 RepID=UPI000A5A2D6A|nr:hypothetical protein [Corynebacterium belfantii]SPJ41768.1 hypothetical protein CHUV2995_02598 [Corynebacterium diphtheriae subsp. lausannense]
MEGATGKNCGACSSTEVHNLFCELLDESTTYARALAIVSTSPNAISASNA